MKYIMTHVVAGYPSERECIKLILGMQKIGVNIIEVQIPFSDPIADGETIMKANDVALGNGMTTAGSFELIKTARRKGLVAEVYVMSYVQKVFHYGAGKFCREAKGAGVTGLIVPDLPFDSPEYQELVKEVHKNFLQLVPVLSPGMEQERLKRALGKSELVYLTSRKGITGNRLSVSSELKKLCRDVREISQEARLAVGFGVASRRDVDEVLKIADMAVVGSSIIREVEKSDVDRALRFIDSLIQF